MSKKQFNSRAPLTITFDQFHGISTPTPNANHSPQKIINFRIGEDGSLQKRFGARTLFALPDKIRSHWSGYLNGSFQVYLLAGNTLYLAHLKEKRYESIGTVSNSDGPATFFCHQATLYLNDGENIYCVQEKELREALGYVPLYGKDWDNDNMGEVNEDFNILNPHVRITYRVSDPASIFLRVPKTIRSVEAIYRNGVRLTPDQFRHNTEFNTVDIPGLEGYDYVEAYLTFEQDTSAIRQLFCSIRGSVFFGSAEKSRTFFFGSSDSDTIFCTEHVTPGDLDHACRIYSSDPLYLPEGYEFRIGEQRHPIHGALRHKDNLLIFTEGDTWLGSVDSTGQTALPSVLINSELGCLSSDGYVLAQNDPITIGRHGLYRWESKDPDITQRDAIRISEAIDSLLTPDILKTATLFYDPMRDELWLNLPARSEIWICAMKRNEWFCFTGISANRFFDADGQVGFFSGNEVSVFEPTLSFDVELSGFCNVISAVYQTPLLNFGTDKKKNLYRLTFDAEDDGALFFFRFHYGAEYPAYKSLYDRKHHEHSTLTTHLRTGRFQNGSLEISTKDFSLPVIHSLTLTAH